MDQLSLIYWHQAGSTTCFYLISAGELSQYSYLKCEWLSLVGQLVT